MSANLPVAPPPLTRREDRKVIAGVCSGLAYRLGIDPNVVRVVAVVLALFGGAGILLYALGWLLLPEERTGQSVAERALRGGGPGGASTVLLAVALTVVAVGTGVAFVGDSWFGITVLVVAVAIGAVLLSRRPTGSGGPPAPAPAEAAGNGAAVSPTGYDVPTSPVDSAYGASPWQPSWDAPTYAATAPLPAPEPTRPTRPRSYLGAVTVFAALAVTGVLGLIDVGGADLSFATYLAAALAVVGTGLVVGAWFGRSRALIGLGVALVVVLVPVATIERLGITGTADDAFESILVEPSTAMELDGTLDEYVAGDVRYDLSDLSFTDRTVDAEIRVGAGTLDIDLPPEVTLVLDAEVGAGQIDALGEQSSGLGINQERTYQGEEDGGTLRLVVRMGLGDVEVNRAAS